MRPAQLFPCLPGPRPNPYLFSSWVTQIASPPPWPMLATSWPLGRITSPLPYRSAPRNPSSLLPPLPPPGSFLPICPSLQEGSRAWPRPPIDAPVTTVRYPHCHCVREVHYTELKYLVSGIERRSTNADACVLLLHLRPMLVFFKFIAVALPRPDTNIGKPSSGMP